MAIIGVLFCLVGTGFMLVKLNNSPLQRFPWVVWGFVLIILGVLWILFDLIL